MEQKLRPDLIIEAYRTDDGGLFIAYGGTPPPAMCAIALEVAQEINRQFGPAEEAEIPDAEPTDGTDDWFDDFITQVRQEYEPDKYDWDGETL